MGWIKRRRQRRKDSGSVSSASSQSSLADSDSLAMDRSPPRTITTPSPVPSPTKTTMSMKATPAVTPEIVNNKKNNIKPAKRTRSRRAAAAAATVENDASSQDLSSFADSETSEGGLMNSKMLLKMKGSSSRDNASDNKMMSVVTAKQILSRPFGRTDLPPQLGRTWVVEVSAAEWDANENRWKYRILVQRRMLVEQSNNNNSALNGGAASSFTTAFTWRSLADFLWLEDALKAEYHGALVLPLLSIAIGTPNLMVSHGNAQHDEVDATLLKDWLGDVLNGIRGEGEIVLKQNIDIISSEAMEAFLYRNTDLQKSMAPKSNARTTSYLTTSSNLDYPWRDSPVKEAQEESFVDSLFSKPFSCALDTMCGVDGGDDAAAAKPKSTTKVPLDMCASRAYMQDASHTLELQESFVTYDPGLGPSGSRESSTLAIHSELMEAEKELVSSYKKGTVAAMDKMRVLLEHESQVGAAWKRFGICMSNLFSFEKEVETSRVGDSSSADPDKKRRKPKLPYRKLTTTAIDDLLRVIAKQRLERATPSLTILTSMLKAYLGDLSAVNPSINAYSEAVSQLAQLDSAGGGIAAGLRGFTQSDSARNDNSFWDDPFHAFTAMRFGGAKQHMTGESSTTTASTGASTEDFGGDTVMSQRKAFENRVLSNERLLRETVTAICKATPVRSARMAFAYFTGEAGQASLLNSAALSMRAKINAADSKAISNVKKQHLLENKDDDKIELDVVQRIVNIGNNDKKKPDLTPSADDDGFPIIEVDDDPDGSDKRRARMRIQAVDLAKHRLGKWDSDLAMAIMEACGIKDAEVSVEETTRDLRLVRRHAISLRENLERCTEAVEIIRNLSMHGGEHDDGSTSIHTGVPSQPILTSRGEFLEELAIVFSGSVMTSGPAAERKPKGASPSLSILASAGIVTKDPTGWLVSKPKGGKCREAAAQYLAARDAGVENILTQVTELLEEYQSRIESIESFVYMQCVGIQLEKHFSQQRADALTAFEKKTDITTAINIATRKKLPRLVEELQAKMEKVAQGITHTTVKESKEAHLLSKQLKTELSDLANRRFQRVRETALDRVVAILSLWAKYEESTSSREIQAVGRILDEVERSLKFVNNKADGVSHLLDGPIAKKK